VQVKGGVGAIRQVVLFTDSLAAVGGGLEIRSISVLQSDRAVLPTDYETVLELRSGELWTIADGKRVDRSAGDMWLAPRGSRLTLHLLTEHAVLRAISLIK
jgi:hypothetical protein